MKNVFTRAEVAHMLLALIMFSNANDHQGLDAMSDYPTTFGEKANHLLHVMDDIDLDSPKSVISTVTKIKLN
jgi:hypothetical protein